MSERMPFLKCYHSISVETFGKLALKMDCFQSRFSWKCSRERCSRHRQQNEKFSELKKCRSYSGYSVL